LFLWVWSRRSPSLCSSNGVFWSDFLREEGPTVIHGLTMFLDALAEFMRPVTLFHVFWATQLGIIIGMLPGLTATMGVALLTTLTFKMEPSDAILILISMYVGAIYGGSRTAILLNIPG